MNAIQNPFVVKGRIPGEYFCDRVLVPLVLLHLNIPRYAVQCTAFANSFQCRDANDFTM